LLASSKLGSPNDPQCQLGLFSLVKHTPFYNSGVYVTKHANSGSFKATENPEVFCNFCKPNCTKRPHL
jgi:hypothetical protein